MAGSSKQALRYFLGTCLPSVKQNAVKVSVPRLELDKNIFMVRFYFKFKRNTLKVLLSKKIISYFYNLVLQRA